MAASDPKQLVTRIEGSTRIEQKMPNMLGRFGLSIGAYSLGRSVWQLRAIGRSAMDLPGDLFRRNPCGDGSLWIRRLDRSRVICSYPDDLAADRSHWVHQGAVLSFGGQEAEITWRGAFEFGPP